ncbi:MAG: tRNA (adenosine(37)-N6)-dimethylallyltransferase MiaA [Ignavibacteriaceae bacterium]|nr:tRNA (adenosine(37)-N6)-dimethylallyltransferase MiaA [Ignavibacteriaceae bacterium]
MERKVIVLAGPTCSGKTTLGVLLADKLNSEIISADSRQFYKYLDLGTAKPGEEILKKVKHHFINVLEPDEYFNVSLFEKQALNIVEGLLGKDKIPIVVGGSGLYIKALTEGIFDEADINEEIRSELMLIKERAGIEGLYKELEKVDAESAAKMLPQNWKRVLRALEVFYTTGQPIWKFHEKQEREVDIDFKMYGLNWEREVLYKNIEARVDDMITNGLIEEIKYILDKGYSKTLNSLNTVGYKEIISYLDGEISQDTAVDLIKRNTRRYAKRQMTWFRKVEGMHWFDVASFGDLDNICEEIIKSETLYEREN